MKTLLVLRHAKSSWDDPSLDDHDRPLNPRGARAGTLIGRHLAAHGPEPDLVLCSTARRARDTLALVEAQHPGAFTVEYDRGLYLPGELALLGRIQDLNDTHSCAMIVAHNPDLQQLVLMLAADGDPEQLLRVRTKYPTGALATLVMAVDRWAAVAPGTGRLADLVTPKTLKAE